MTRCPGYIVGAVGVKNNLECKTPIFRCVALGIHVRETFSYCRPRAVSEPVKDAFELVSQAILVLNVRCHVSREPEKLGLILQDKCVAESIVVPKHCL